MKPRILLSAVGGLCIVLLLTPIKSEAASVGWIDSNDIRFTEVANPNTDYINPPALYGGTANRYCNFQDIIIKPKNINPLYFFQKEVTDRRCVVDTIFGTTDGSILIRGSDNIAGPLKLRSSKEFLLAGRNLHSGITYDLADAPSGSGYVSFSRDLFAHINTKINSDGTVIHELNGDGGLHEVSNAQNQKMQLRISTAAYSNNAKWLVFDSPYYGFVRLNTETGETLSFGNPTSYNNGFDARYSMTISSNGRYVVVSRLNRLEIYDLENCSNQTGPLSYLKKCKSRSLEDERMAKTGFGLAASRLRFTSDESFIYYTDDLKNGIVLSKLYRVTIGMQPEYGFEYLGLGDSFASGEGAFGYKSITDSKENMCHLSLFSYPYLIGAQLNKEKYESDACSGAIIDDVYLNEEETKSYPGQFYDGLRQDGRDIESILNSFTPGKVTQHTFVAKINPEAVTISVGGNDIGFGDKLTSCIANLFNDTCFMSYEDRIETALEVKNTVPRLKQTYEKLKEGNRRVYVVGYPKLIDPEGDCANNVKLNNSEADFADKLVVMLNDGIEVATKQAGVVYVNVENLFMGRRLCETSSENTLVHGITQGNDAGLWKIRPLAKESFHPKLEAGQYFKNAILSQTENLTKPMPIPNLDSGFTVPSVNDNFWSVEKSNRNMYNPIYQDMWEGLTSGQQVNEVLSGARTTFLPLSQVTTELHSSPISFGTFTADELGNVNINFTVPESATPGFHSLHLYGKSISGQPVDVYDYFFIRATDTDFDGDGVLDKDEGCILARPIGVDSDEDGVDDACDSFSDPLPEKPAEEPQQTDESGNTNESNLSEIPPSTEENVFPPESGQDESEVVPLPEIQASPDVEKNIGNNETVAGNEDLMGQEESAPLAQNPIASSSVNTAVAASDVQIIVARTENANIESIPEVLSDQIRTSNAVKDSVEEATGFSRLQIENKQSLNGSKKIVWYALPIVISVLVMLGVIRRLRRR